MSNINRPRRTLLDGLADVIGDMYRTPAEAGTRLTTATGDAAVVPERAEPAPAPASEPVYAARPSLPDFRDLWKTADESIDWTEALSSRTPTDGLTDPAKWTLYHEQAASVLHGNTAAYLTVLKAANPMADLMPFVSTLDVSTRSSDELRAVFTVRPDLLDNEPKRYLSGMALRIARDLFAVLPVSRVIVTGRQEERTLLTVSFERPEMNKVRFTFIDPVEFVTACGGEFAPANA